MLYFNITKNGANYYSDDWHAIALNYCLMTPLPTNGVGNIDSDPRFVDPATGNFRLRPDSTCIDAGTGHERTLTDPTVSGAQRFYRVRRW